MELKRVIQRVGFIALSFVLLTFSACNKEELKLKDNATEMQKVAVAENSAARVENTKLGELWIIPNGWIGKNGGNITSTEIMATCTVKIKDLRQDFTYYPTVYVQVGSVNFTAVYRQNGQLKTLETPRTNLGVTAEANPFKISRRNLLFQIDKDEIIFIATRASNVNVAKVEFRIYRDYTNNPLLWTSPTLNSNLPGNNCVSYIRGKITSLASASVVPLNWYYQKQAIANVRDDQGNLTKDLKFVRKGMAVIMPIHKSIENTCETFKNGQCTSTLKDYGHIAYVSEVHSDGTITVTEGMQGGSFSTRRRYPDTRSYYDQINRKWVDGFNVYGYYHPKP